MKKFLLLIICFVFGSGVAFAERVQYADQTMDVDDENVNIQDSQGNRLEIGKNKQGNARIVRKYKNSPIGKMELESRDENTVRFGLGGQLADLKKDPNNPNKIIMINPNGNEKISIEQIENEKTGETEIITRNETTGKIIRRVKKKADGSVEMKNGDDNNPLTNKTKGLPDWQLAEGESKGKLYKKELKLGLGKAEILLREKKTGTVKYKVDYQRDYSRIYDEKGNLIAEGPNDSDAIKIYNKNAYDDFKKIMDSEDDVIKEKTTDR